LPDTNIDSLALKTKLPNAQIAAPSHYEALRQYIAGAQTTGVKKHAWIVPFDGTIVDVRTRLDTAPVGSTFIVDVNKNGTTVFTTQGNRPTIAIGANVSSNVAPDVTAVAAGDQISFDIDQIGSGTAGSDLYVAVTLKRANVA
jgi:hypothetical protein